MKRLCSCELCSPAAARVDFKVPPAPRLDTLEGKTIGLYDNMTGGAGVAVDRVAEHIGRRYANVKFESYGGPRRDGRPAPESRRPYRRGGGGNHCQRG